MYRKEHEEQGDDKWLIDTQEMLNEIIHIFSRIIADETFPMGSIVHVGNDEEAHPTVICRLIEKHYENEYNSISQSNGTFTYCIWLGLCRNSYTVTTEPLIGRGFQS